jgi:hypothetical protein
MEAVKAQNDARFSEVMGKLDSLTVRIEALPRPIGFWEMAGLAASGLVFLITILGIFADRFDGGISAYGLLDRSIESQKAVDRVQDERNQQQDARIEKLIEALEARPTVTEPSLP